MEKYGRWRDSSTGINPFMPVKRLHDQSSHTGVLLYRLIGIFLAAIRIPILILFVPSWFITVALAQLFFGHYVIRIIDKIYGRITLFLLGFFSVPCKQVKFRDSLQSFTQYKIGDILDKSKFHARDLLIVNCSGPVDIIYLSFMYSPHWTCVGMDGSIYYCSRFFAFLSIAQVFDYDSDSCLGFVSSYFLKPKKHISDLVKNASAPIAIFPEGTTSNGRAILKFTADLSHMAPNQRTHIISLKYSPSDTGHCPTMPQSTHVSFFTTLCCQWYSILQCKWISAETIYASSHFPVFGDEDWNDKVSMCVAALCRAKISAQTCKNKKDYLQALYSRPSTNKKRS